MKDNIRTRSTSYKHVLDGIPNGLSEKAEMVEVFGDSMAEVSAEVARVTKILETQLDTTIQGVIISPSDTGMLATIHYTTPAEKDIPGDSQLSTIMLNKVLKEVEFLRNTMLMNKQTTNATYNFSIPKYKGNIW